MSYQYNYLIGGLSLLIIWIFLYLQRKDLRKEMLIISLIMGLLGLLADPIYAIDWWSVLTITNTMPGIESFILGFTGSGIASVIYSQISNKKVRIKKMKKSKEKKRNINFAALIILALVILLGSHFFLKLNTFQATFPAIIIPLLIIWYKRKDLITNSLFSGLLLMIISLIFYLIPEIINPGWLATIWNFDILSGVLIFNVALEDLIYFFLIGAFIGPIYEYWKEGKLVNLKK